ncbi:low molecular weight phosphatase family protein [Fodinibius salsisoli]|uniref:Protein-tyrosine-phosphatase n=1 Tax=Fodinibius salsisoli TaxID=2820877 RepID=A0ABT3PRB9_9BACT|nr:protein-tyrosine-phosphatase [Fodinibius salsisoli]MCW9708375.1 protein-tyrosine-phosphatase [Fodinibius salsisoli]
MYQELLTYIQQLEDDTFQIGSERKQKLRQISDFISSKVEEGSGAKLTFVCTHNSRRSHFCQVWAAVLAHHFGLEYINTFSGGTEETAFNPRAVAAIERAGFKVENPGGENPRYKVFYAEDAAPLTCFSKTFDDEANPQDGFAAIMTCSDADENCPLVPGTSLRISIPYIDPKESDGTPGEAQTYDERCRQIASEMYYMLSQLS